MVLRQRQSRINRDNRVHACHTRIRLQRLHPVIKKLDVRSARDWAIRAHGGGHWAKRPFAECVGEGVERLTARDALGEDAAVWRVESHPKPRRAEGNQEGERWQGHGDRSAHHGASEARPGSTLVHLAAPQAADGEPVHARSEEAQDRWHQRDAGGYGDRHGDRTSNADAAQDRKIKEGESGQAEHHRDAREEDGAPSSGNGALHRVAKFRTATELLAESRDEKERVVHAKPKAEQRGEIQDEDAHARCLRNSKDRRKCNEHRCATNRKWQSRRNRRSKDKQQDNRRKRKADQLTALQVGFRDDLDVCIE